MTALLRSSSSLNSVLMSKATASHLKADAGRSEGILARSVIIALCEALEARKTNVVVRVWQLDALLRRVAYCEQVLLLVLQSRLESSIGLGCKYT